MQLVKILIYCGYDISFHDIVFDITNSILLANDKWKDYKKFLNLKTEQDCVNYTEHKDNFFVVYGIKIKSKYYIQIPINKLKKVEL